jgi:hypothetical protein
VWKLYLQAYLQDDQFALHAVGCQRVRLDEGEGWSQRLPLHEE